MESAKKFSHGLFVKATILQDFFHTLWKYKLWWSFPIIFIMVFVMILLSVAGHTGVAAIIYPLF